ncbi:hypothetical protein ECG_02325 [Echinococcus granulosus]|uniref:Uncharacterized protein n=1 Tax=Echinococcus granulosus TaxID=6210 RepID=U6JGC4_ECHGR|nr:hypothetical protein EGR_08847 [Echinococcus granulosus]EUB56302.1 hypothetical protein EGR_08847 [Echinococcus granulosus]KAH9284670.1 hypothetical protein ECG_02325 [Echinococcus granulosus]CDS23102.1 hypothetical protein EgrG_002035400 [Echinococcus granulosus]
MAKSLSPLIALNQRNAHLPGGAPQDVGADTLPTLHCQTIFSSSPSALKRNHKSITVLQFIHASARIAGELTVAFASVRLVASLKEGLFTDVSSTTLQTDCHRTVDYRKHDYTIRDVYRHPSDGYTLASKQQARQDGPTTRSSSFKPTELRLGAMRAL